LRRAGRGRLLALAGLRLLQSLRRSSQSASPEGPRARSSDKRTASASSTARRTTSRP
jgi:hypothetical protein